MVSPQRDYEALTEQNHISRFSLLLHGVFCVYLTCSQHAEILLVFTCVMFHIIKC